MNKDIQNKKQKLISIIERYDHLMVAFSGGVDSTFLLETASKVLHKNVIAVTAQSPIHPERETEFTKKFAKRLGIKHIMMQSREMKLPEFVVNNEDRCYVCKKLLAEGLLKLAAEMGIQYVAHGANVDDLDDFRPGFKAAVEMGIIAPLLDAKMTKKDIRRLSQEMGLAVWNKPSMACLASRIPYGIPISGEALDKIDRAERFILSLGFISCRVRYHNEVARIEVSPGDFKKLIDDKTRTAIINNLKDLGFLYISMDLEGYISGSLNRSFGLVNL
ncbi:MAG: ATP-dependent sacrificial sulfur transferase LarE [Thermodesulfobacteriota bacterium]|nr:ATP-dependent sacrificial sulfur transferase LarE [Thermodesulfobacteriota bacterium]